MTRDEWLAAFSRELGVERPTVEEIRELLDLAGRAAHSSERTAAPISCWLAARSGMALSDVLAAADRVSAQASA